MPGTCIIYQKHALYHSLMFPGLSHSYLQLCHTKSSLLLLPPAIISADSSILLALLPCYLRELNLPFSFSHPSLLPSSLNLFPEQLILVELFAQLPTILFIHSHFTFLPAPSISPPSPPLYFPQPHSFALFFHRLSSPLVLPHLICPPCTFFSPISTYSVLHLLCCHYCHFQED